MITARDFVVRTLDAACGQAALPALTPAEAGPLIGVMTRFKLENLLFCPTIPELDPLKELYGRIYNAQCAELARLSPMLRTLPSLTLVQGFPFNRALAPTGAMGRRADIDLFASECDVATLTERLNGEGYFQSGLVGDTLVLLDDKAKSVLTASYPYPKLPSFLRPAELDITLPGHFHIDGDLPPLLKIEGRMVLVICIEVTTSYGHGADGAIIAEAATGAMCGLPCASIEAFVLYSAVRLARGIEAGQSRLRMLYDIVSAFGGQNGETFDVPRLLQWSAMRGSREEVSAILGLAARLSARFADILRGMQLSADCDDAFERRFWDSQELSG